MLSFAAIFHLVYDTIHPREKEYNGFPNFRNFNNILSRILTREMYSRLKTKVSPNGFTIENCIQIGVDDSGSTIKRSVGCVAGEEESYGLYSELLDPLIEVLHNGYKVTDVQHHDFDYRKINQEELLDEKYVLSCRVRTVRNIRGFALETVCSRAERRKIESLSRKILQKMKGTYYSVGAKTQSEKNEWIEKHLLFKKPYRINYRDCMLARDWPDARGVWLNPERRLVIWVNEEDHLRIFAIQKGGNMKLAFKQLCNGVLEVEQIVHSFNHQFMWNKHHGFISTCPTNLGTGIRAGVLIRIPLLSQNKSFKPLLKKLRLQKRGTDGENTSVRCDIIDISQIDRMGRTEVELVQKVIVSVKILIELEKKLEQKKEIDIDTIEDQNVPVNISYNYEEF